MSKGLKIGLTTLGIAMLLLFIDPALSLVPLALFLLLLLAAPFMYRFGFFLPIVSRGRSGQPIVALTFDDGPDPVTTPLLLERLAARHAPATFFVTGRRAAAHPELIRAILAAGHTIGNHSYNHDTLAAFKGPRRIFAEIAETQRLLTQMGVTPLLFRPPVGITYPGLGKVLPQLGLTAVTFSCRARDGGNRAIGRLAARILRRVRADDIIMLHDSRPQRRAHLGHWLAEIDRILAGIAQKGLAIRPLAELIGRPVELRPGGDCASRADRPPGSRP
ncbi:MAG: polysaccharide deacetylase family protein [Desulfobacterales bacterium]|nr:polysaccharide deacetylase family protein [Desulfobacterales bacterium]